jgi:hypothetical protein
MRSSGWAGPEPSTGLPRNGEGGRRRPPSRIRTAPDQRFALDFLRAAVAFAVRRFRVAAAFLPAATRFVDLRAVVFLRAGFLAVDFLAAVFLLAGLRDAVFLAVDFLRAGFLAVDFLAAVFLLAGLRAAVFLAVVFLRAGFLAVDFLAAVFLLAGLRAAVFLAAIPVPLSSLLLRATLARFALAPRAPRPPWLRRVLLHDAIRLRRRRSRSLMPPHTPYRSSRRSA